MSSIVNDRNIYQEFSHSVTLPKFCLEKERDNNLIEFCAARKINIQDGKFPQWFLKRILDYCASLIILLLLLPLFALIAVAIKLDSEGPVFYKQKRVGLKGKEFEIYKFRSMKLNADSKLESMKKFNQTNEKMFKMFDDPRVTRVGKFIRKHSLDELPQLINVLKGDMSLVGFRPPIPAEVNKYERWHHVRFSGIPGLTGIWQVSGRSNIKDFDKVVRLEVEYINNWSIMLDLTLILKTIPVVLFGKDAA